MVLDSVRKFLSQRMFYIEIYHKFKLDTIKTQIALERARLMEQPDGRNQVQSSLVNPLEIRIEVNNLKYY